jgi:type IV secretory pathway component VirB8
MLTGFSMNRIVRTAAIAIALALCFTACARMPSTAKSAKVIKKYFNKYGKKYPDTEYGKNRVQEVEITDRQEIHKHFVAVESFVTLKDGTIRRIYATLEKGPLGWRFVSWENITQ